MSGATRDSFVRLCSPYGNFGGEGHRHGGRKGKLGEETCLLFQGADSILVSMEGSLRTARKDPTAVGGADVSV